MARALFAGGAVIVGATLGWMAKADRSDLARVELRVDSLARHRDAQMLEVSRQLDAVLREVRTVKTLVCDLNARDTSCRSTP